MNFENINDSEFDILYHTHYSCSDKSITGNTDIKKHRYASPWTWNNWYKQYERFTIKTPNVNWDDLFIDGNEDPTGHFYWFTDSNNILTFINYKRIANNWCVLMWDNYAKQYCCFVKPVKIRRSVIRRFRKYKI